LNRLLFGAPQSGNPFATVTTVTQRREIGQHLNTGAKSSMTNKQTLRSGERLRRRVSKKIEDSTLKLKVSAISRGISNKAIALRIYQGKAPVRASKDMEHSERCFTYRMERPMVGMSKGVLPSRFGIMGERSLSREVLGLSFGMSFQYRRCPRGSLVRTQPCRIVHQSDSFGDSRVLFRGFWRFFFFFFFLFCFVFLVVARDVCHF
jgi:hypothetical protein